MQQKLPLSTADLASPFSAGRTVVDVAQESALYNDRKVIGTAGWFVAFIGLGLLLTAITIREFTPVQMAILSTVVGLNFFYALAIRFANQKYLHRLVVASWCMNSLAEIGQVTAFYFGPESTKLLNGISPVLMVVIPLQIVWAHTMLKPRLASFLSRGYILIFMLLVLVHGVMYWGVAANTYAMALMAISVFIIAPISELLMTLHSRMLASTTERLVDDIQQYELQQSESKDDFIDAYTGLLNREGVVLALGSALIKYPEVWGAKVEVINHKGLIARKGRDYFDSFLLAIIQVLVLQLPKGIRIGRVAPDELVIWHESNDALNAIDQERLAHLVSTGLGPQYETVRLAFGVTRGTATDNSGMVLEELSFRCMMNRVEQ